MGQDLAVQSYQIYKYIMDPGMEPDMSTAAGGALVAKLPLVENQDSNDNNISDDDPQLSFSPTEFDTQFVRQTAEETAVEEEDNSDMKPPRTIKSFPVKRRSKQLPRLFIATKRLLASTTVTEKCSKEDSPGEMFPLPMSSEFIFPFHTINSDSPGLTKSLPDDLIQKVTSFLDVLSLLQVRACSHTLKDLASQNAAGWEHLCRSLWADKVHVLAGMQQPMPLPCSLPGITNTNLDQEIASDFYMNAYRLSTQDAKHRQYVTMDELCYDPGKITYVG